MKEILVGVLFIITAILLSFSFYSLTRKNRSHCAVSLGFLVVALAVYSGCYAGELLSRTLGQMLLWNRLEYLGISFLPAFWIVFCGKYVNTHWISRKTTLGILYILSIITLFGVLSDPFLHLRYATVFIRVDGPFPVLAFTRGPLYWYHACYTFLSFALCSGLLLRGAFAAEPTFFRWQQLFMLAGSFFPWVNYMLYLAGIPSWPIDTVPFSMFISVVFFGISIMGYRILDIVPVARGLVFETMSDGAIVLDHSGLVVDYNRAAAAVFPELEKAAFTGSSGNALSVCVPLLTRALESGEREFSFSPETESGTRHYQCRISIIAGRSNAYIGKLILFKDNTDSALLLEKLQELATIDPLTKVFNRRHFFELASHQMAALSRAGRSLAVILLDLDHFKLVNDTYGHPAGDDVLCAVAGVLTSGLRPGDFVGRFGGEEFVCFLAETGGSGALATAERLRIAINEKRIRVSGAAEISISASFGVCCVDKPASGDRIEQYVALADRAMYQAKKEGRNTSVVYSAGME